MDAPSQQGAVGLDEIAARAERASTPLERAGVRLEYFERGTKLTEFMGIWVRDLELVLDAITNERDTPRAPIAARVDGTRIGLLGMSYGGGAITEVCKTDARCRAAMNMDGGLWGSKARQPLTVPYLALASPANAPFFEHDLLTSEAPYYELTVAGAAHLSFTDVSVFVPLLKWLGVTGTIEGARVIDIMNVAAAAFFDAHVRGAGPQVAEFDGFSEIAVQTNLKIERGREPVDRRPTAFLAAHPGARAWSPHWDYPLSCDPPGHVPEAGRC
jgi:predicted dienelactone hydrolase